jgi:hypothetical protein
MTYKFQYTMGDWSYDGHNMTEVFQLEAEKPLEAIIEANKKVSKLIDRKGGFQSLCEEYEDCCIPRETVAHLEAAGIDVKSLIESYDEDECYASGTELLGLWVAAMNAVDTELGLRVTPAPTDLCVSIGSFGYGCYSGY